MPNDKMTIQEAAAALGVSRNTIFNLAQRGLLRLIEKPYGRPRYYVPRQDVTALLKKAEQSERVSKREK